MSADGSAPIGPDLAAGVQLDSLRPNEPLLGHVGDEAVMLVRDSEQVLAVGATCTHYGGPLAEGLVTGGTVRCPWHHACFDLRNGKSLAAPALAPIACYEVKREQGKVAVGRKREPEQRSASSSAPSSVVIVGAGPAGLACAVTLRQEGYAGPISLLGAELPGPVDRPNLSKDYLAGSAQEEWIPLRTSEALSADRIELVANDPVMTLDSKARSVTLRSGRNLSAGALVLATGAEPVSLSIEGATLPHVHLLRTLSDARSIIDALPKARKAVVIGSSFIGLEVAASLRQRNLEVTVIGPDSVPLARVLGDQVGQFIRKVHETNGVRFRLGIKPQRITAQGVVLPDGSELPADLIVVGIGVRPRTALAEAAGLTVDKGIVVDESFRTSASNVYAIGDVARFPYEGQSVRIEHFAVAERQGQSVARSLTGSKPGPFGRVPFFWSQHHDVVVSYVGHAERFELPEVQGSLADRDATVIYREKGSVRAVATVGRERASLLIERAMELGDAKQLEALVRK